VRVVSGSSTPRESARLGAADDRKAQQAQQAQQHAADKEKPHSERRRSTLTSRFPLLRKASRDPANSSSTPHIAALPSIHIRGSSASIRLPSADSPFLSTGEPRASVSSTRGRITRQSEDLQPRAPSNAPSNRSSIRSGHHDVFSDAASTHSTTPLTSSGSIDDTTPDEQPEPILAATPKPTAPPSAAKDKDRKMHQTSSRLLRMTDDERPFTRVS
jgi:hypothetical protein